MITTSVNATARHNFISSTPSPFAQNNSEVSDGFNFSFSCPRPLTLSANNCLVLYWMAAGFSFLKHRRVSKIGVLVLGDYVRPAPLVALPQRKSHRYRSSGETVAVTAHLRNRPRPLGNLRRDNRSARDKAGVGGPVSNGPGS